MGRKNRKFIDKKSDVVHCFKVVSRSQRDPLVADETAPQAVLVDQECENELTHDEKLRKYGIYFDDDYDYLQHIREVKEVVEWESYDLEVYTLRDEDPKCHKRAHREGGLVLPSSAFESYVEEPIGLLNKAAPVTGPRPELDPDIVAELDSYDMDEGEVYCPEDAEGLPDNFVSLLNSETPLENFEEGGEFDNIESWLDVSDEYDDMPPLEGSNEEEKFLENFYRENNENSYGPKSIDEDDGDCSSGFNVSDNEDEEKDDVCSLQNAFKHYKGDDTRSRTSLSSSVVPRSELLTILDERFELKFSNEYNDDQLGALDGEEIEGFIDEDSQIFQQAMKKTKKDIIKLIKDTENEDERIVQWIKEMNLRSKESEETEEIEISDGEPDKKWDCESILSTYSNIYNHPQAITEILPSKSRILINSHRGMPDINKKPELTRRALNRHDQKDGLKASANRDIETETLLTSMSAISFRPPGETSEERRERKNALKELRRERRIEKKLNQLAFKEEKKLQEKSLLNKRFSKIVSVI